MHVHAGIFLNLEFWWLSHTGALVERWTFMSTSKDWFAKCERWSNCSDEADYSKSEYGSLWRHRHINSDCAITLSARGGDKHFITTCLLISLQ